MTAISIDTTESSKVIDRLKLLVLHPSRALVALLDEYLYPLMIRRKKGVRIIGHVQLRGLPMIDAKKGGSIMIEDNVMLNSRNWEYHINMHSSVKLLADRPGPGPDRCRLLFCFPQPSGRVPGGGEIPDYAHRMPGRPRMHGVRLPNH